jgi:hypothetical protein
MKDIKAATIKEIRAAKDIVMEIRNFGVNDNIICMIVEQLALDLTDIELMREMRELASRGSSMAKLKEMGKETYRKAMEEQSKPKLEV